MTYIVDKSHDYMSGDFVRRVHKFIADKEQINS